MSASPAAAGPAARVLLPAGGWRRRPARPASGPRPGRARAGSRSWSRAPASGERRFKPSDPALEDSVARGRARCCASRVRSPTLLDGGWQLAGRAPQRAAAIAAPAGGSGGVLETAAGLRGIDLIHAFLEPYETAIPAAELAAELGVPWIADLQDPWALDEANVKITRWHLSLERSRMRRGLRTAAAIVMNTPEAAAAAARRVPRARGADHARDPERVRRRRLARPGVRRATTTPSASSTREPCTRRRDWAIGGPLARGACSAVTSLQWTCSPARTCTCSPPCAR